MKILLVDDSDLYRDGMRHVLSKLDDRVDILEAANFPDALSAARDNPDFDLVLLDLNMPGSAGAPSVALFHEIYPNMPVVVISGTDKIGDIENVLINGAKSFISKMTNGSDMVQALQLVLAGGAFLPTQLL